MSQPPSTTALERVQAFLRLVEHDKAGAVFHYGHELSVADLKEAIGEVPSAMTTAPPTEQELLPCPFCGGPAKFIRSEKPGGYGWHMHWVACANADGPCVETLSDGRFPDQVIAVWNTRSTQPSRPQGEEMLREFAWLIELYNEGPQWFCGGPDFHWTRDSLKAIRFSRKADAEQFASWCTISGWPGVTVGEHEWVPTAPTLHQGEQEA